MVSTNENGPGETPGPFNRIWHRALFYALEVFHDEISGELTAGDTHFLGQPAENGGSALALLEGANKTVVTTLPLLVLDLAIADTGDFLIENGQVAGGLAMSHGNLKRGAWGPDIPGSVKSQLYLII